MNESGCRFGAVILAGGKSRRMGRDKAGLMLDGVRFLDKLVFELSSFEELLVSVDDARRHPEILYPMVSDIFTDCGPMGGVYAALKHCVSDALVVISCDVPLFSKSMADAMCACLKRDIDAVIAVTSDGQRHPLCGVYKKSCLPMLQKCLEAGNYRMQGALEKLRVMPYPVGEQSWRLGNINTPEDYLKLQTRSCLAVCGWKNSGKTTLMERLIAKLSQKGLKVAAIKHDGHSFDADVPGTDSYRFFKAGADTSVVYDGEKYAMTKRRVLTEDRVSDLAPEADIFLLEGFKYSAYPKLEIVQAANKKPPVPDICGRLAFVSDCIPEGSQGQIPVFAMDAVEEIAAFVMEAYECGKLRERWNTEDKSILESEDKGVMKSENKRVMDNINKGAMEP